MPLQDAEHILQVCASLGALRNEIIWPESAELGKKLWGSKADLILTADFIKRAGLKI